MIRRKVDFRDSSINSFRCKTDVITGRRATEATIDFFHAPSQLVIDSFAREKKGGGGLPTTVKSGEIGDSSYIYYAGTETYALGTKNRRGKATKNPNSILLDNSFQVVEGKNISSL